MIYAVMGTRRIVDCSSLNISSYDTGSHDFLKDKSAEEIFSIVQLLTKEVFDRF
jgi:hypothetical protein